MKVLQGALLLQNMIHQSPRCELGVGASLLVGFKADDGLELGFLGCVMGVRYWRIRRYVMGLWRHRVS